MNLQNNALIVAGLFAWFTSGCASQREYIESSELSWGDGWKVDEKTCNPVYLAEKMNIQKHLPYGWMCHIFTNTSTIGSFTGLDEPLFAMTFVNKSVTLPYEDFRGNSVPIHPNFFLFFYDRAGGSLILEMIEATHIYSSRVADLFTETSNYIIVENGYGCKNTYAMKKGDYVIAHDPVGTEESNKAIAPLFEALHAYFDTRKPTTPRPPAAEADSPIAQRLKWLHKFDAHKPTTPPPPSAETQHWTAEEILEWERKTGESFPGTIVPGRRTTVIISGDKK